MTVIDIINNKENLYEGDLKAYFKNIWNAPNVELPYHNLRHMLHVLYETYNGIKYYRNKFDKGTIRNMLIAALYHDFGHTGKSNDELNIKVALSALSKQIQQCDMKNIGIIRAYIEGTKFPHDEIPFTEENLPYFIIRDADTTYTLADVWIQTVNFGLNKEFEQTTEEMLKFQETYLTKILVLHTDWARMKYGPKIPQRIEEVKQMIDVLYA